jgi:integrase
LKKWESLRVADISAWIINFESLATVSRCEALVAVRFLFKALFLRGRLSKPLHQMCLIPRFPDDCRPPQIWDFKDIKRLLGAVDRRCHLGKRDYAILLLAIRLGLRSCDIRLLRLDNIRWDEACIDIVQQKTKRPLRLPMSNDIGDALADYLRHGRPKVSQREVFLRNVAPFVPLTSGALHCIIRKYRSKAGLSTSPGYGMHSLRHTVATQLMVHGVPHKTISDLLGHVHPDTTRRYLRTDIPTLRTVGLDPDEEVRHV